MKVNTSRSHQRFNTQHNKDLREFFGTKPQIYKRGTRFTLISLLKNLIKMCLRFPLYTRRRRSETLILNGLNCCLGLIQILQIQFSIDRALLSIDQTLQFCTIELRLLTSYCYLKQKTYYHDHVTALSPWTTSFLDLLQTQVLPLLTWNSTQKFQIFFKLL